VLVLLAQNCLLPQIYIKCSTGYGKRQQKVYTAEKMRLQLAQAPQMNIRYIAYP
jgi:hypothetical protein